MMKLIKKTSNHNVFPAWLAVIFGVIIIAIFSVGHWFNKTQNQQLKQKVTEELETISRLKKDQIVHWRKQRLADASEIMSSPFFIKGIDDWLIRSQPDAAQILLLRFKGITQYHYYSNVLLVDVDGRVLLSLYEPPGRLSDEDITRLAEAVKEKKPVLSDLHSCYKDAALAIDVITPLFHSAADPPKPIGALILKIDPDRFLFPLVQSWPVPSRTAETVLVRRDGDQVLFLNKTRYRNNAPLDLKIPISRKELPSVNAVLGKQGVFTGKDYRGMEVLSVLTAIPDSPWFLVTKIDTDEAFAQIRFNRMLIIALTIGFLATTLAVAGLLGQYLRKLHYKTVYKAEMDRLALIAHFEHLVKYANDIIVLADENFRIIEANDRAVEMYGYTKETLLSLTLSDLVASEDMDNFKQRLTCLSEKGSVMAEAIHRRNDGVNLPVEISAREIKVRGKKFIQSIVRDIRERKRAEAELRSEQERFQVLIENAPFGMVIIGNDGIYKYINPRFKDIFGYDLTEIPNGREWFRKAFPDLSYRHHVISSWISDLEKTAPGETRARTYLVRCKDGEEKFVHFIPILMENGENLMFCDDITEQIKAEETLKESEERYSSLFNRSLDCVYLHDFKGNVIDLNEAALNLLGYEKANIKELNLSSFLSREQLRKTQPMLKELFETGYQKDVVDFKVKHKDGHEIDLEAKASLVYHDGKPYAVQGVARDISKRKQAEEQLQKLAMVIHYSSEMVSLTSLGGKMIFLNHAGGRMLGIDPAEVEKHHILETIPGSIQDKAKHEILPLLMAGGTWEGELQYQNLKTGQLIDAHAMTFPIKDPTNGEVICLANVSLDITERKCAEKERIKLEEQLKQSQKLESIGRLAGGVAHDFNNMLAIIIGYADILLKDLHETNPVREKTKEILKAAERARDLTRQLLAFARKQTLEMSNLELNLIVSGFEKMLRRALRENVTVKIHLSPTPCIFKGDVGQVEQILLNLAINAQDAMPDGGTLVLETATVYLDEAYAKNRDGIAPGKYVMLEMSDSGLGMGKDVLDKIFDPFYTTKEVGKGTGLGLSTVYGIVKQHGGSINVYSEPGKGTSFKVYFPQIHQFADPARESEAPAIAEMGKETVLVVEDNEQVRNLSCEILKMHGYQVIDTPDGKTALEVARTYSGPIHLLITDVIMPDINGKELHKHMVKTHSGIKTLFMSGYPEEVISHHGVLDAGVKFIQKPFSLNDFVNKVRQVLDDN